MDDYDEDFDEDHYGFQQFKATYQQEHFEEASDQDFDDFSDDEDSDEILGDDDEVTQREQDLHLAAQAQRWRSYDERAKRREREEQEHAERVETQQREEREYVERVERQEREEREYAKLVQRRQAAKPDSTKARLKQGQHHEPKSTGKQEGQQDYAPRATTPCKPARIALDEPPDPGEPAGDPSPDLVLTSCEPARATSDEPPDPGEPNPAHCPTQPKLNVTGVPLKYDGHTVHHSEQRLFLKNTSFSVGSTIHCLCCILASCPCSNAISRVNATLGGQVPRTDMHHDSSFGPQRQTEPPKMSYNSSVDSKEFHVPRRGMRRPTGGTLPPQFEPQLLDSLKLRKRRFWQTASLGTYSKCALDHGRSLGGGWRVVFAASTSKFLTRKH